MPKKKSVLVDLNTPMDHMFHGRALAMISSSMCEHRRQRHTCKECGGTSVCGHGKLRHRCKECGGASVCAHDRLRYRCKECLGEAAAKW